MRPQTEEEAKAAAKAYLDKEEYEGSREFASTLPSDELLARYREYIGETEVSGAAYIRVLRPRIKNYEAEILQRMNT